MPRHHCVERSPSRRPCRARAIATGSLNDNFQTIVCPGDVFAELPGINNAGKITGLHGATSQGFALTLPNTFSPENPPDSTATDVAGISNTNVSSGFFPDGNGTTHGLIDANGTFSTLGAPGTNCNQLLGINHEPPT